MRTHVDGQRLISWLSAVLMASVCCINLWQTTFHVLLLILFCFLLLLVQFLICKVDLTCFGQKWDAVEVHLWGGSSCYCCCCYNNNHNYSMLQLDFFSICFCHLCDLFIFVRYKMFSKSCRISVKLTENPLQCTCEVKIYVSQMRCGSLHFLGAAASI